MAGTNIEFDVDDLDGALTTGTYKGKLVAEGQSIYFEVTKGLNQGTRILYGSWSGTSGEKGEATAVVKGE